MQPIPPSGSPLVPRSAAITPEDVRRLWPAPGQADYVFALFLLSYDRVDDALAPFLRALAADPTFATDALFEPLLDPILSNPAVQPAMTRALR